MIILKNVQLVISGDIVSINLRIHYTAKTIART